MAFNPAAPNAREDQEVEYSSGVPRVVDFSMDLVSETTEAGSKSTATCENFSNSVPRQLMDIEILYLLNFGPKTGYDLKKHLLELFRAEVSYGTIYPHLHSLQKSGLIQEIGSKAQRTSEAVLRKITYALTHLGALSLRESIANLGRISFSMNFTINKVEFEQNTTVGAKSNERLSTLHTLQAILERRGYTVLKDTTVRGFSGTNYQFEIVGTKSAKKQKEKILVQLVDQRVGSTMGLDRAMKILVTGQDIGARILLLAIPRLNTDIADFLNFHGISTFDANTWQEVLADFVIRFGRSLE